MTKPIGTFFLDEKLLTEEQIAAAWQYAKTNRKTFEEGVLALNLLDEFTLASNLGRFYQVPFIDLANYLIDPVIGRLLPEHICRRHGFVALNKVGNRLTVAFADPTNVLAIDDIQLMTGLTVKVAIGPRGAIMNAIDGVFSSR